MNPIFLDLLFCFSYMSFLLQLTGASADKEKDDLTNGQRKVHNYNKQLICNKFALFLIQKMSFLEKEILSVVCRNSKCITYEFLRIVTSYFGDRYEFSAILCGPLLQILRVKVNFVMVNRIDLWLQRGLELKNYLKLSNLASFYVC